MELAGLAISGTGPSWLCLFLQGKMCVGESVVVLFAVIRKNLASCKLWLFQLLQIGTANFLAGANGSSMGIS